MNSFLLVLSKLWTVIIKQFPSHILLSLLFLQENAKKSWLLRNAESLELAMEDSGSEEETVKSLKQKKISSLQLKKLQQVSLF